MRGVTLLAAVLVALVPAAAAEAKQTITVAPERAEFGETVVIKGVGWPVIEFCSRRVRLSLVSDQNAFRIGRIRTRANGRFRFEWVPRRSRVGVGRWTVVARQRCESGDDGSKFDNLAEAPLRIRRRQPQAAGSAGCARSD